MTIIDARQLPARTSLETTVCVVGSGPAGTAAAVHLARAGLDVIVIEAGGKSADRRLQDTYSGLSSNGTLHDPMELVRQKRLGGTSWQWGGRCAPLDRLDFEKRSWVSESGWPIGLDDLGRWYRDAQTYCGLGEFEYRGPAAIGGSWTSYGEADSDLDGIWRWGPPVRFHRTLLAAGRSTNLRILTHANVTSLVQENAGGPVRTIVAATQPGRELRVTAQVFVLAAGALESTRILLTSPGPTGIGIGNDYGLVGRHYTTHPVAEVGKLRLTAAGRELARGYERSSDGVYIRRILGLTERVQESHGLLNLKAATWYPDPTDPAHGDSRLSAFALVRMALAKGQLGFKASGVHRRFGQSGELGQHVRNIVRHPGKLAALGGIWVSRRWLARRTLPSFLVTDSAYLRLRFDAEQTPDPANRVTLSDDRDEYGVPRLTMHYRVTSSDRANFRRSLELLGRDVERRGLGTMELPAPEVFENLSHQDGTHQMGLLRMSTTPQRGVVDSWGRVHSCPNLFIASSGVFPTGGAVGPTLTIVALALRTAERIRSELQILPA